MMPGIRFSLILLSAAIFGVFFQVRHFHYVSLDDDSHTELHPHIQPLNSKKIWTENYRGAYTPVTDMIWSVASYLGKNTLAEEQIAKANPFNPTEGKYKSGIFHLTNVILHLITVFAVFGCLFIVTCSPLGSFCGALFFGLHPLQVESVAWVTGLRDVAAGAFGFLSLFCFFLCLKKNMPRSYFASLLFFLLAILSKSSALVFLVFFPIFLWRPLRVEWKRSLRLLVPYFFVSIPFIAIFIFLNQGMLPPSVHVPPFYLRPIIAMDSLVFYLSKLAYPLHLATDYSRTPAFVFASKTYQWTVPIFLSVAVVLLAASKKMHSAKPIQCAGIFIAGLAPVLGMQPFIYQDISTVADHYVYLAMFGPALFVAWAAMSCRTHLQRGLVFSMLFLCGVFSGKQTQYWRNNFTLFTHNLEINPKSALSANNLGASFEKLNELDRALAFYELAANNSDKAIHWYNVGQLSMRKKEYGKAIFAFLQITRTFDTHWANYNVGVAWKAAGDLKLAKYYFEKSLSLEPRFDLARQELLTYEKQ